jgi:hypothetical protein
MNGFIGVLLQLPHEITSSTLQLFSGLLNSLRLTVSQLQLNVSHITLLGNSMNLEESVVSRNLVSVSLTLT